MMMMSDGDDCGDDGHVDDITDGDDNDDGHVDDIIDAMMMDMSMM